MRPDCSKCRLRVPPKALYKHLVRLMRGRHEEKRALCCGCGNGRDMEYMERAFWDLTVVSPTEAYADVSHVEDMSMDAMYLGRPAVRWSTLDSLFFDRVAAPGCLALVDVSGSPEASECEFKAVTRLDRLSSFFEGWSATRLDGAVLFKKLENSDEYEPEHIECGIVLTGDRGQPEDAAES